MGGAAAAGAAPKASELLPLVTSFLERCGLEKAAAALKAEAKKCKDGAVRGVCGGAAGGGANARPRRA